MTRLFAGTQFDIPPTCEVCENPQTACSCTAAEKAAHQAERQRIAARIEPSKQTASVQTEKRKGNRTVTVVDGLTAAANDLPDLTGQLQTACGTGGTCKPKLDRIEIQGNHVAIVQQTLRRIGYRVK